MVGRGAAKILTHKGNARLGQHFAYRFPAGAGVKGGRVIGMSDKTGQRPITKPINPLVVGTTIADLAGIDAGARTRMNVLNGGTVIHELF